MSAVTHYFAARRTGLAWITGRIGKSGFWDTGEGLSSGAAHLHLLCTNGTVA